MENKREWLNEIVNREYNSNRSNNIEANLELGVSQEYNSNKYDNTYKRNKYKNNSYEGKKTQIDPITGKVLHKSADAALNKYGHKNVTKHTADTDHIISKKEIHNGLKRNPFLTDDDVREIANQEYNFRVTSTKFNRSKGSKKNIEMIKENWDDLSLEGKKTLALDSMKAKANVVGNTFHKTGVNVAGEFGAGAKNSIEGAAIPIMLQSYEYMYKVSQGEMEFEEAAIEMGKFTSKIAISGGAMKVAVTGATNTMKNSANVALKKIANTNQVGQIISISLIMKDSIIKLIEGEINGEEFFKEVGEKGVGVVGGTIGAVIGQVMIPVPVVGAFIGSVIISTACVEIYKFSFGILDEIRDLDKYKIKASRIISFANSAIFEIERQNEILARMVKNELNEGDEKFKKGFLQIKEGVNLNSINEVSEGINEILSVFSKQVRFNNLKEFNDFFDNDNLIFEL